MVTWQEGSNAFIDALADKDTLPGGGSAAAFAGAMGAALLLMAIGVTLKRKATTEADKTFLKPYLANLENYKEEFKKLTEEDAAAYLEVVRLKKQAPVDEAKLAQAQIHAAEIPLLTAQKALGLLKITDEIENKISKIIVSDLFCAKDCLIAALNCCRHNIKANLPYVTDENLQNKLKALLDETDILCPRKL